MSDNPQPQPEPQPDPPKPARKSKPKRESFLTRLNRFKNSAAVRDIAFGAILLLVELVLAARYGADTYRMALAEHLIEWQLEAPTIGVYALATLDVLLIDGVFMLMLIIAKYAGQSSKASKIRPATAAGAVIMFVVMLGIATGIISVIAGARWAGGLLLAYVISDIAVDSLHRFQMWLKSRKGQQSAPFQDRLFAASTGIAYIVILALLSPIIWIVSGGILVYRQWTRVFGKVTTGEAQQIASPAASPVLSSTASAGLIADASETSIKIAKTAPARAARAAKRDRRLDIGRGILESNPDVTGPEYWQQLQTAYKSEFGRRATVGKSTALADLKLLREGPETEYPDGGFEYIGPSRTERWAGGD